MSNRLSWLQSCTGETITIVEGLSYQIVSQAILSRNRNKPSDTLKETGQDFFLMARLESVTLMQCQDWHSTWFDDTFEHLSSNSKSIKSKRGNQLAAGDFKIKTRQHPVQWSQSVGWWPYIRSMVYTRLPPWRGKWPELNNAPPLSQSVAYAWVGGADRAIQEVQRNEHAWSHCPILVVLRHPHPPIIRTRLLLSIGWCSPKIIFVRYN